MRTYTDMVPLVVGTTVAYTGQTITHYVACSACDTCGLKFVLVEELEEYDHTCIDR